MQCYYRFNTSYNNHVVIPQFYISQPNTLQPPMASRQHNLPQPQYYSSTNYFSGSYYTRAPTSIPSFLQNNNYPSLQTNIPYTPTTTLNQPNPHLANNP